MSSADRLIHTSSAEKGIPGVSGGLSGSKNGFWERFGHSKAVRGALAGLGLFGLGAKYDQPAPVDFPQQAVIRNIEDMGMSFWGIESDSMTPESRFWTSQNDTLGMGDDLKKPDELQQLLEQIDERLRELHRDDFSLPVVVDPSETVSEARVLPRSTGELTTDQVGRVFDSEVAVRIDREAGGGGDNFTNAAGRALSEVTGSQLDPRSQWRATVALLGDNGLRPDEVKLVHHGDQFQLQVGEKTTGVLQGADLALGEAALVKLAGDGQSDQSGDAKVDYPETVQVEENSPPADDPPKENTPPVSGGPGGGTPGGGSGTTGGSSGGASSGKEAAPAAGPSDSGPAKENVPDPEPAKERVPAPEPAKEKVPPPEPAKEKPPVVKPPEKPGEEEERSAQPAQPARPPVQEVVPPAAPPLVPPITGLRGVDMIVFGGEAEAEPKLSPGKRVVHLEVKRGDTVVTSGQVDDAPVREVNVFFRGVWFQVRTPAVPTNGDFGQLDGNRFAIHSRVDRLEGDRKGPGVIQRAVALKGVREGDEVRFTKASGEVQTLTVVSKSFEDPQNVGGAEGEVVISTCDPDNMLESLEDRKRLVIVAKEVNEDKPSDNSVPVASGLPLAAIGAMLAAKREEDKRRRRTWAKSLRGLFGVSVFTRDDDEQLLPGEVKQEDEA